jgi:hypothetical protein
MCSHCETKDNTAIRLISGERLSKSRAAGIVTGSLVVFALDLVLGLAYDLRTADSGNPD